MPLPRAGGSGLCSEMPDGSRGRHAAASAMPCAFCILPGSWPAPP